MKIEELEKVFRSALDGSALDEGLDVCVEVTIPGQEDTEFIINRNASIENKLNYYQKTYGENCVHCMNDRIKIVSVRKLKFKI